LHGTFTVDGAGFIDMQRCRGGDSAPLRATGGVLVICMVFEFGRGGAEAPGHTEIPELRNGPSAIELEA